MDERINYEEQADLMNADADLYLTDRIAKVNASDYDFIAEIHLNAGGMGTECYYHKGSEIGRKYADAICKEIAKALGVPQRSNGTDDGATRSSLAQVRGAKRRTTSTDTCGKLYRVQVGAYNKKSNAETMLKKVKAAGFSDAIEFHEKVAR